MKLTLSEIAAKIERRYTLDKPVNVEIHGDLYHAYELIVVTRTYQYGEPETSYSIRGWRLKKNGTPDERHGAGEFILSPPSFHAESLPDPRAPFIRALNCGVDENN